MSDEKKDPNAKLERFGRYLILDHLVDGGMAKICRARFLGEQADKLVAIKMVQPQFSKDPNFKTMFMDEIKVAFGLLHPNIAQTYDYGMYREQLYTAMEYIDGANLKQFLDRLKEKGFAFPVDVCVHITAQICQGLHYAHTFTDKLSGKPQNLVHRDISPHNVMITYDGAVKVIDFGIAKAESNSEATQAGTIKGKLSYLAPEYLDGLTLDHRYDQFAVGITLWELLCSRKLFTASNDLAVLKLIQACKIPPPSTINPNVPKELDAIVLKALSKDRTNRYENMDKFNRELVKFLYAKYADFNASDLSAFAKELFKEEIKRDRAKFLEYGKIEVAPYLEELKAEMNGSGASNSNAASTPSSGATAGKEKTLVGAQRIELDLKMDAPGEALSLDVEKPVGNGGHRVDRTATGIRRPTATAGVRATGAAAASGKSSAALVKDRSRVMKDVQKVKEEKKNPAMPILVLVAGILGFAYFQPEMVHELTGIDVPAMLGHAPERNISSTGAPEAEQAAQPVKKKEEGVLTLSGIDPYMEVYINNEKVSYSGVGIKLAFNREMTLKVEKHNHTPFETKFTLTKAEPSKSISVPELVREQFGLVSTSNNYTEGSVLKIKVNGQEVEKQLPFDNYRLPAGTYEGVIKDPLLGTEKSVNFQVEEDKKITIE